MNALPSLLGALVGGVCTFLGSYYLSERQRKNELRTIAKALDIDISNIDISITPYYGFYHLNTFPVKDALVIPPDPFYDTKNGLYFVFNHDMSRFDYNLSSDLYQFYNNILMLERDRQFVNKFWNSSDGNQKTQSRQSFMRMKMVIKSYHENSIPKLRKELKNIFEKKEEEGSFSTHHFDQA